MKPNRGTLTKNANKVGESQPDFKGIIHIDGQDYWLSAWKAISDRNGDTYLRISAEKKTQALPTDEDLGI